MDVASEHEGSQDQISERLVLGDRLFEAVIENLEDLHVGLSDGGDVDRLAGQHRQVTHEAASPVDGDHSRLPSGTFLLHDPDLAVQDDEHAAVAVSRAEQRGALGQRLPLAVLREQQDLLVIEPGIGAGGVGGLGQVRHLELRRTVRRHSTISSSLPARSSAR